MKCDPDDLNGYLIDHKIHFERRFCCVCEVLSKSVRQGTDIELFHFCMRIQVAKIQARKRMFKGISVAHMNKIESNVDADQTIYDRFNTIILIATFLSCKSSKKSR